MNEKQRYRQLAKIKAEFAGLFKWQETAVLTKEDDLDPVLMYPTGGLCVLKEYTVITKHFYAPDLRLICREAMSPYGHKRALYDKSGNVIWLAEQTGSEAYLYLPRGVFEYWEYIAWWANGHLVHQWFKTDSIPAHRRYFELGNLTYRGLENIRKISQAVNKRIKTFENILMTRV